MLSFVDKEQQQEGSGKTDFMLLEWQKSSAILWIFVSGNEMEKIAKVDIVSSVRLRK